MSWFGRRSIDPIQIRISGEYKEDEAPKYFQVTQTKRNLSLLLRCEDFEMAERLDPAVTYLRTRQGDYYVFETPEQIRGMLK